MKFKEIYKSLEGINGWMGEVDCACLNDYASRVSGTIVEIGCFMGRSSKVLSLSTEAQVHSCDPFGGYEWGGEMWSKEKTKELCLKNMEGIKNWHLHHMPSLELAKKWDKPIDLLFIDGAHDKYSVLDDTRAWMPFLKPNHFVLYHDYGCVTLEGVKEAVDFLNYEASYDFYYKGYKSCIKICRK